MSGVLLQYGCLLPAYLKAVEYKYNRQVYKFNKDSKMMKKKRYLGNCLLLIMTILISLVTYFFILNLNKFTGYVADDLPIILSSKASGLLRIVISLQMFFSSSSQRLPTISRGMHVFWPFFLKCYFILFQKARRIF